MAKKKHTRKAHPAKKSHKKTSKHTSHHPKKKKKDMGEYVFGVVVFIVLIAIVAGLIYLSSKSGEFRIDRQGKVAATVNGEDITTAYLDDQYGRVPAEYRTVITKTTLLNQTINEVILLQEAESKGIAVSEEDVTQEIENAMATAGISADDLDERLAEQNITREYLEDLYLKQLTINALLEAVVFEKISVTESDIAEFYDSRIRAMHILVESEPEAMSIIDDLKRVSLGDIEDKFSEMATELSTDPSAEVNGGDLGEFGRGQMVPDFEKAAFALEEYAFTAEPVQTQFGYHVILRLPKEQSLDEQYSAIEELLLTQKKAQAVPLYVDQLRSKSEVEIFFEEAPAASAEV